ncbi:hypothetical protein DFP72DRAFT_1174057 [Ephemerocybe angulata]|uniref:Uncharacterized protein n=1 Tax=Ephemerocybe angulata TaxID=980116 RepID=A0A8H6HKY9_9AGAR|nr:hypothetical protein DFP72DRAFT_1174057 [Tulosesus angulatus]
MTVRTNSEKALEDFNKVLFGESSKSEAGKRKRRDEGEIGRDEGSCDEVPTSQPDEDMQYQNSAFENANKRTKRVAELTVFPTKAKAKVIDKFEDEFAAGASKRAQSKHSRHAYNSCNVSAKPSSVSKVSDACRRTYPEQSTSDDDELLMQYKPRKSPEASCKPLSSSSKSTKPPSSNSLPGPSFNATGTSVYFTKQTREHERHDTRENQPASTMESSLTRAPLIMSPFAPDTANDPPSTLNGRRAENSKPQPAHTDANKPAVKRDQMRRAAPSGYPSTPFKPPGSSASSSHHNNKPPSSSSSTKPTPTASTRPNHPPQQHTRTHSRSGPSRERATSPFETQQEKAIQGLLSTLEESASTDSDSHPLTTASRPSAIRIDSPFPETRSRTRQKRPPSPIDVDSYMIPEPDPAPSSSKPAPAPTSSKPAPPAPAPPPASTPPPDDLPHKYQQLQKRFDQITQQANQHLAEASRLQADAEARLERTEALLRTRTEELSVAQAFMVTADRVSVAEVVRAVEEVNDLVFQCAVDLSDAVLDARAGRKAKGIFQTVGVEGKGKAREAVFEEWGRERLEKDVLDASSLISTTRAEPFSTDSTLCVNGISRVATTFSETPLTGHSTTWRSSGRRKLNSDNRPLLIGKQWSTADVSSHFARRGQSADPGSPFHHLASGWTPPFGLGVFREFSGNIDFRSPPTTTIPSSSRPNSRLNRRFPLASIPIYTLMFLSSESLSQWIFGAHLASYYSRHLPEPPSYCLGMVPACAGD